LLYATIRQRKIHVKNPSTVIQNGVNVDQLILELDDEWALMDSIVAVFTLKYADQEIKKEMLHTFGTTITVPWECLAHTGQLMVSCTGYVEGEKVMTTMYPDSFWNVVQNGPVTGDTPMEPTPTLYEQVLAAAGAANSAATQAAQVSAQLMQDKENGVFNGDDGISPTVTVGTVLTGASGSEAQVNQTGTPSNVVLNFVLPRGVQGERGPAGATGPMGLTGPAGPQGIQGIPGEQGPVGPAGADGVIGKDGTTFTPSVNANGDLSWSNNGGLTNPATVNIRGPKGDTGDAGPQGQQGDTGPAGYTPVRGTDYWTDEDKAEIVNAVLSNFADVSEVGM
jgi:hypothetical protein